MSSLARIENILWDWNGTLLDDVDLCVTVISELCQKHLGTSLTRDTYRAHFGFPVVSFYQYLGFDTSTASFKTLSEAFISTYYAHFENDPPPAHRETVAFAQHWQHGGRGQAVLSASRQDHLEQAVGRFQLGGLFQRLGGVGDIYARSKVEQGHALLGELRWDPQSTLLVGDTDHDAEVAEALGVECLLLARGHQHPSRLRQTSARVVDSLAEASTRYALEPAYQGK